MKFIFLMISFLSVLTHAQTSEPEIPGDSREWIKAADKKVWPMLLQKVKLVDGNKITLKVENKADVAFEKNGEQMDKEISVYYKKFYIGGIAFSNKVTLESLEPTRMWLEKQIKVKKVLIEYGESIVHIERFAIVE